MVFWVPPTDTFGKTNGWLGAVRPVNYKNTCLILNFFSDQNMNRNMQFSFNFRIRYNRDSFIIVGRVRTFISATGFVVVGPVVCWQGGHAPPARVFMGPQKPLGGHRNWK